MKIILQRVNLREVMQFYAESFKPAKGETIRLGDTYVDTAKEIVIFELYVGEPKDERARPITP